MQSISGEVGDGFPLNKSKDSMSHPYSQGLSQGILYKSTPLCLAMPWHCGDYDVC